MDRRGEEEGEQTFDIDVRWPVAFYMGCLTDSAGVQGWIVFCCCTDGGCVEVLEGRREGWKGGLSDAGLWGLGR